MAAVASDVGVVALVDDGEGVVLTLGVAEAKAALWARRGVVCRDVVCCCCCCCDEERGVESADRGVEGRDLR